MAKLNALQQSSRERVALVQTLKLRSVHVSVSARHAIAGIRWRGPYVITAAERLEGAGRVRLRSGDAAAGEEGASEGEVLACDLSTDVAVIRSSGTAPPATPEPIRDLLELGESVAIVAHDRRGPIASFGLVSASGPAWHSSRGGEIAQRLEICASLDERFEGALVADMAGQIGAMLVRGPRGRALGIPAVTIERIVQAVELHGHLPQPYLGVRVQMMMLDSATAARFGRSAQRIAVIAGIDAGSPAAAAGLSPGDLIETIEGEEIDGAGGILRALAAGGVGGQLALAVRRGGERHTHTLRIAERPGRNP